MSRARHEERKRAKGGKVAVYAGEGSNVLKEAHERKRGGRVHHGEGEAAKERHDHKKRARGGKVKHESAAEERAEDGMKHGGHVKHHPGHHKGRARGGKVGSNRMPLSTAANIKEVTKGESAEDLGQH